MQRVTPGKGDTFGPVEKAIQETLLLALFEGLGEGAPERGVILTSTGVITPKNGFSTLGIGTKDI